MPNLIDPRYCCCAVPLVNAGIYLILAEQAIVGLASGVLAVGAPNVTGAAVPSFTVYIFAILCWAVVLCQPAGFIGVLREKTTLFKIYSAANAILTTLALICAAALIAVSAARHSTAVSSCETTYFSSTNSTTSSANSTLTEEGKALCDAFAWADIGFMGGLWVILFICQAYFVYTTRSYSVNQVSDHKLYHSVYSENPEAFTMSILRSTRYNPGSVYSTMAPPAGPNADAWDSRPSFESVHDSAYGAGGAAGAHRRGFSDATTAMRASRYEESGGAGAGAHGYQPSPSMTSLQPPGGYGDSARNSRYDDAEDNAAAQHGGYAGGYGYQHQQGGEEYAYQQQQHQQQQYPQQVDFSQAPDYSSHGGNGQRW